MKDMSNTTKRQQAIQDTARSLRIFNRKHGLDTYQLATEQTITELLDESGWANWVDSWNVHTFCEAVNAVHAIHRIPS